MKKKKKISSQLLRVEDPDAVWLITVRCVRSELWFVNNKALEERILAFLAMYLNKYKAELFAYFLLGNHYHLLIKFPLGNMASFFRDLNARVAEAVRRLVPNYEGGGLLERRYAGQYLADDETIEDKFFYTWLQPVTTGLCAKVSEYPARNCFSDAVRGIEREYKYFSYSEYNETRKKNPKVSREDFWRSFPLKFTRLPRYKDLSAEEYEKLMFEKLETRRAKEVVESEHRYKTKSELRKIRPGSKPGRTKKGSRTPIVLAATLEAKSRVLEWYFSIVEQYKEACKKYRNGEFSVPFPAGTYRPPGLAVYT